MGSKNKQRNRNNNSGGGHEEGGGGSSSNKKKKQGKVISDPRFDSVHWDPRFKKVSKHKSKLQIDSRFNRIFNDKSFAPSSAPLDKRGKIKKRKTDSSLTHFYRTQEEDEEEEEKIEKKPAKEKDVVAESSTESDESESEVDLSELESSTDTDEEENKEFVYDDEDTPDVEVENVPVIEEGTRRLAVVNMDWRHVRAVDLYVVLCSFLPKGGEILSVAVYPSEFGLQRMKDEDVCGPVGLFDDENKKNKDDDDDDSDFDEINPEKLRAYEKSRLRYYYAVVECDSVATADNLYKNCDGAEFERSSNVLDLRYIPDSMEFKHPPRDVATEAPASYGGLDFHTKALQHSNIPISWDEDEPHRVKILKRKFNDDQLAHLELKEFLASDESDTDDGNNDHNAEKQSNKKHKQREKYLSLIQSGDGSDGDDEDETKDIEITFNTGLEDLSKRILEKRDKKSETVWEAHQRKQREKRKARKNKSKYSSEEEISDSNGEPTEQPDDFFVEEPSDKKVQKKDARTRSDRDEKQLHDVYGEGVASREELELLLADDKGANNGLKGYNLKPKKDKGKKEKGKSRKIPDEDNIPAISDDPRFSSLFTSPLFALDPTDPQYKRSAHYARQVVQRQQKVDREELIKGEHVKQPSLSDEHERRNRNQQTNELSSLVRSIKMKSKQVQSAVRKERRHK